MEGTCASETSVDFQQTTRCYIREGRTPQFTSIQGRCFLSTQSFTPFKPRENKAFTSESWEYLLAHHRLHRETTSIRQFSPFLCSVPSLSPNTSILLNTLYPSTLFLKITNNFPLLQVHTFRKPVWQNRWNTALLGRGVYSIVPLIVDNDLFKNSSFHIPSHYSVPDSDFQQ
jgi:hypothetical protein